MQKLVLILAVAFSAMAAMVPVAAAETADPPHRDKLSDWTGISAYEWNGGDARTCDEPTDCAFSRTAPRRVKGQVLGHINVDYECSLTMAGAIDSTGAVDASPSSAECGPVPTVGKVCRHKLTGEYWLRLMFDLSQETPSFAQIVTDPSNQPSNVPTVFLRGVMFGNTVTGAFADLYTIGSTSWNLYHRGYFENMWDSSEVIAGRSESGAACSWPELS